MLMNRVDKLRRCAALQKRVDNDAAARVAEESRRRSAEATECRERVVKRARAEPTFRSLSVGEDEGVERALQTEAAEVYRSVNNTTMLPDAPLEVSDTDRDMEATFKVLLKAPSGEEINRHWEIATAFESTVDDLRNKMPPSIVAKMDAVCKTVVAARGIIDPPVAWEVAKGFDQSAKYMIAEAAKAERELLAAACGEFVEKERALIAAAQASEADQPEKLCYNDECVVCFEAMPTDNPLASDSGWTILACKHGSCTDCLGLWQQSGGCACPICRKPIPGAVPNAGPHRGYRSLRADEDHRFEDHLEAVVYRTALFDEDDLEEPVYRAAVN